MNGMFKRRGDKNETKKKTLERERMGFYMLHKTEELTLNYVKLEPSFGSYLKIYFEII
jgi:hypothetical protein